MIYVLANGYRLLHAARMRRGCRIICSRNRRPSPLSMSSWSSCVLMIFTAADVSSQHSLSQSLDVPSIAQILLRPMFVLKHCPLNLLDLEERDRWMRSESALDLQELKH